jgi:hypothetical protein
VNVTQDRVHALGQDDMRRGLVDERDAIEKSVLRREQARIRL